MDTTIHNILTGNIKPSPMNPRKSFNEDALRELADNISSHGLLQPITVRPLSSIDGATVVAKDVYEIVCGERRYRACCLLGMVAIPCIIREMSDDEAFDAMITENLQRKYFEQGRDKEVFKQALEKEKELDDWNARTSSFLAAHTNFKPVDAKAHAFFLIVVRWRRLWKNYFAYKKRSDADPAIVRERGKECRYYEAQIDKYIKETIGL